MSNPLIAYPACGTFSISILSFAPTNKMSIVVSIFFKAFAIAIAGKMCPPVPPPAIMIRLLTLEKGSMFNIQRLIPGSVNGSLSIDHFPSFPFQLFNISRYT